MREAIGKHRTRQADFVRERIERPLPCRLSVDKRIAWPICRSRNARQPSPRICRQMRDVLADDLDEQHLGKLGQHGLAAGIAKFGFPRRQREAC